MSARLFLHDCVHKLGVTNISGNAAELAYYFMFSAFPFFLFLATLLGYIPIPHLASKTVLFFGGMLPPTVTRVVSSSLHSVLTQKHGGLLSLGILVALWSASTAVSVFATTLDNAYGVQEARPYWKLRLQAIVLTVALSVLVIATVGLSVFGTLIDRFVMQQLHIPLFHQIWSLLRWPVAFVLAMFELMVLYRYSPNLTQTWKSVLPGAAAALAGIVGSSLAFAFYVDHFGSYNKTYGAIGAIIVLLTWLYLLGLLILVGGVVNSVLEGAVVADSDKPAVPNVERRAHPRPVGVWQSHH